MSELVFKNTGESGETEISDTHPLPVRSNPTQGTLTDRSGTITTGGTAKQLMAANANRKYLLIQNPSTAAGQEIATAESLWINFTTNATTARPSIEVVSGGSIVMDKFVSTELISVNAATAGHAWIAKEG